MWRTQTAWPGVLQGRSFDIIIFYASLEHMVHEERLRAIADTWAMLRPGDLWCVVEPVVLEHELS
jgi:2-polyprenyl-3-methyl-5-hydroxy-6-metoxy-1,4-benzoquinol methylase